MRRRAAGNVEPVDGAALGGATITMPAGSAGGAERRSSQACK